MMVRNHRGVSLAELLGAIVLLALVTSLVGAISFAMLRAIDRIAVSQSAETTGLYLISELESTMQDAMPTTYSQACVGTGGCVILVQEYYYDYDSLTGAIILVVPPSPLETLIAIQNGTITINGVDVGTGAFTLGPLSTLSTEVNLSAITITIAFELLASDGRTFPFTARYEFTESTIPA